MSADHTFPTEWSVQIGHRAIWVHGPGGDCLGRFGLLGIDVHRKYAEQHLGECLDCTHGMTTKSDWTKFQESMFRFHGVDLSDLSAPEFVIDG